MATIVCDSKKFVFVHIPKCAGMAIATQLQSQIDWDKRFTGSIRTDHEALGPAMAAHTPLTLLEDFYPRTFAKYLEYDTYAIVREPKSRFVSSMAQHLREFHKKDLYDLSPLELEAALDRVINQMCGSGPHVPVEFVHFTRQHDYVFLRDAQIVKELFTTSTLPDLAALLSSRYGLQVKPDERRNQTFGYKSAPLKRIMHAGGMFSRAVLPGRVLTPIREVARRMFLVDTASARPSAFSSPPVEEFVNQYYEQDFALWKMVETRAPETAHAPNTTDLAGV